MMIPNLVGVVRGGDLHGRFSITLLGAPSHNGVALWFSSEHLRTYRNWNPDWQRGAMGSYANSATKLLSA